MIPSGTTQETAPASPERAAEVIEEFKRDLGNVGITTALREEDVTGYPADVDQHGDYIPTVNKADAPAKELKPGDIGYSSRETGPQVLGQ